MSRLESLRVLLKQHLSTKNRRGFFDVGRQLQSMGEILDLHEMWRQRHGGHGGASNGSKTKPGEGSPYH